MTGTPPDHTNPNAAAKEVRRLELLSEEFGDPIIAHAVASLRDARRRTLKCVDGLRDETLRWRSGGAANSIGDLLYHIALVEADWLFDEVVGIPYPEQMKVLLPAEMRDAQGRLSQAAAETLGDHLRRLLRVREELEKVFRTMTLEEFRRLRHMPAYDVSPEWILHHLAQHEAEHRNRIRVLRRQAEAGRSSAGS